MTNMRTVAIVLACVACMGHARRVQQGAAFNPGAGVAPQVPSRSGSVNAGVWYKDAMGLANVVVVGAGVPKRGMGWYHAKQMIDGDVPSAKLTGVVEPWFLGGGADSDAGKVFKEWADEESKNGVGFYASVSDLPPPEGKTLALISGRTADNPRLLKEVIEAGCTHVFLEKPGAPTVAELEDMKKYAAEKGVPVWMGYNKNVAKYVLDALEEQKKTEGSSMTFIHNNAYKEEELPECFERNAEGMLKNMAIHELALLATYYGVTVDNIDSVDVDKDYSSCQTLKGPDSGKEFTDFGKVGFTVKTKDGKSVTVKSDRCGCNEGGNSVAIVSVGGEEKFRTKTPDEELKKVVDVKAKEDPEMMPYFFLQSDDYVTLKERCTAHMVAGKPGAPPGLATLDIGIDALKVAEYLTPLLQEASK
mmetsp:Transcript_40123/g.69816  ORF Transcript_40123/g.69816 Transcript_40123/m.69816 type:complete len:418 (-) Transcript_40123:117-1370(-)